MKVLLAFLLPALLFAACGEKQTAPAQDTAVASPAAAAKENFEKSRVLQLQCRTDAENRFALYLPAVYDGKKPLPLVLFFDPHAAGALPLEKYKSLAEKYGVILAGSNVSKNGMDFSRAQYSANTLLGDLGDRLSIDPSRILLGGFSGGARVAGMVAANSRQVAGVIGCSASLPGNVLGLPFFYTGIAGLSDMNYLEMRIQHEQLDSAATAHAFLVFPGTHEWAPLPAMDAAFAFQLAHAGDTTARSSLVSHIRGQTDSLVRKKQVPLAADLLTDGLLTLKGSREAQNWQKERDALQALPELKKIKAEEEKLLAQEGGLQQQFLLAMSGQQPGGFDAVFRAADTSGVTKNTAGYFMRKRLWGFMSLVAFSYCNQAFQQGNAQAITKYTDLYKRVDPQNSEWAFLKAKLAALSGDQATALDLLETCIALGFKDRSRLEQEPAFKALFTDKRFQELLKKAGGQ